MSGSRHPKRVGRRKRWSAGAVGRERRRSQEVIQRDVVASGGSRIARDERGRGEKDGLTIDGEVVESDNPARGSGGHRWVGEEGAVEGAADGRGR